MIAWIIVVLVAVGLACSVAYHFGVLARFGGPLPTLTIGLRKRAHGLIFGRWGPFVVCSPTQAEGHCITFGPTGSGKSSALLIPTLQSWNGTFFAIDIAGDLYANVHPPGTLVYQPESPDTVPYNVFDFVDSAKEKGQAEVWERLERLAFWVMPELLPHQSSGAADFFRREGRKMLTGALVGFYDAGMDFVDICTKIIESDWRGLLNDIAALENDKANQYIRSFAGANEANTAGVKQAVDAAVQLFATNETVKKSIRRPQRDERYFSPGVLESRSVFVVVTDTKLALYAPLLSIIVAQILDYMGDRQKQNTGKILLCLDEFASLGKLDILGALRKLRKKHVRIFACTQSLADLDLTYGFAERRAMMENLSFKVVLGAYDGETQEVFSKLIGERPEKQRFSSRVRGQVPMYERTKPIIPPADLARLGRKLVLLSPDGFRLLRKNFYFK